MGENALIIHESFETNSDLQYHLSKGTAEKYKKDIDKIAFPENYFLGSCVLDNSYLFQVLHLPATYSSQGSHYTANGGSMSDGIF
jgi:hypothetical protein